MQLRRPNRSLSLLGVAALLSCLGACTSSADGPREFAVAPGSYDRAFDATRDALRELDLELDRVDAASGVITTRAHFSPGLLEPWDSTQTGLAQEWEDTLNMQARDVRVTFAPREALQSRQGEPAESAEGAQESPDSAPVFDLRQVEGELVGTVWVTIYRQHRAGRRLDSEWVGGSTFFIDPELGARAGQRYLVPLKRDEHLESRLAAAIGKRIAPASGDHESQ